MRTLPNTITTQKNKISTPGSWLVCIDIAYPSLTASPHTHYRFVNNIEDVVLDGNTYAKWAFGLGQVKESIKGELPRITLSLYDVNLTMKTTLQNNDGWSGREVSVRRVYVALDGTITDTDIIHYFTILSTVWNDSDNTVNFTIGVSTPLSRRFPRNRYVSTICRHRFKGGFCRYTAPDVSITSDLIEFITGSSYNTIWDGGGGLITNLFRSLPGEWIEPTNLITNGDFEIVPTGATRGWVGNNPTGWSTFGTNNTTVRQMIRTNSVRNIVYHYEGKGDKAAGIYQRITVPTGAFDFYVSCWARGIGSIFYISTSDNLNKSTSQVWKPRDYIRRGNSSTSWVKLDYTIPRSYIPANNILYISLSGDSDREGYFDDVSMYSVDDVAPFTRYSLNRDTGFVVSGSDSNDGLFIADSYHALSENYVRVSLEGYKGRSFIAEPAGNNVTLSLGFTDCDHSLEDCRQRDNSHRYGGSPGVAGGLYG